MQEKKYYLVPAISNSTLSWFQVSPLYCWKRMNREIADEEKSYSLLGKQLHLSLLEPDEFEKVYTYLDFKTPTSKQQLGFCEDYVEALKEKVSDPDIFVESKAKIEAYKANYIVDKQTEATILKSAEKIYEQNSDYIKYLLIKGDYREILSKSKQELITTITQSIRKHKKAVDLIFTDINPFTSDVETYNEYPIFWEYPISVNRESLKCKSLIDRLVVDHINKKVTIVDLKTTSVLGDASDHIDERNYYRQLTFYKLAVQADDKFPNDYEIDAYIVSVNTQDPFECKVYKLTEEEFVKQLLEINRLMLAISWHWFTNKWDYSRIYYEGDGTENYIVDDHSS